MVRLSALVVLLALGCDAVPPLKAVDASDSMDAAGPGPFTVTLLDPDGEGVDDIPVVIHNPDRTVQGQFTTNADGQVTQTIEPGASFTMIIGVPGDQRVDYQLITAVGVMPNTEMTITTERLDEYVGGLRFTFPTGPVLGTAPTEVQLAVGCERRTYTVPNVPASDTVAIQRNCAAGPGGEREALLLGLNALGTPVAWSALGTLPAPEMSATPTNNTFGAWVTTFDVLPFGFVNKPADIAGVSLSLAGHRTVGGEFDLYSEVDVATPATSLSYDFSSPRGWVNDGFGWQLFYAYGSPPEGVVLHGQRLAAGTPLPTGFDLAANKPPYLQGFEDDGSAPGTETFNWTYDANGDALDGLVLNLEWSHADAGITHTWAWAIVLPPGTTEHELLPLPDGAVLHPVTDEAAWPPPAVAERNDDQLIGIEISSIDGYIDFLVAFGAGLLGGGDPRFAKGDTFTAVVHGFN